MRLNIKNLIKIGSLVTIPVTATIGINCAKTYIKTTVTAEVDERLPLIASRLSEWRGEDLPDGLNLFNIDRADTARVDSLVAFYRGEGEDGPNINRKRGGRQ